MSKHTPEPLEISDIGQANDLLHGIGCAPEGIAIMAPKMLHHVIRIHDVLMQDAIVLKQDLLSIGGEVAIPKDAYMFSQEHCNILVMGTHLQLHRLVDKLQVQYPRLRDIGVELEEFLHSVS